MFTLPWLSRSQNRTSEDSFACDSETATQEELLVICSHDNDHGSLISSQEYTKGLSGCTLCPGAVEKIMREYSSLSLNSSQLFTSLHVHIQRPKSHGIANFLCTAQLTMDP